MTLPRALKIATKGVHQALADDPDLRNGLNIAGGMVTDTQMQPLRYNTKESLLNPHFLVFGDRSENWGRFV